MKKIIILLFAILLTLTGCKKVEEAVQLKIDFDFTYDGYTYKLGEKFNVDDYEEPESYSEIASCAFEGLDKTYTYEHFELTTYPVDGEERLYVIYFLDDEARTNEGIAIADSYEDMISSYGESYVKEENKYTYTIGKKSITFIVENDFITSIEYDYEV